MASCLDCTGLKIYGSVYYIYISTSLFFRETCFNTTFKTSMLQRISVGMGAKCRVEETLRGWEMSHFFEKIVDKAVLSLKACSCAVAFG